MGKMSQVDSALEMYSKPCIFTLTITALSPNSYDKDLALIKRVHKRFRESFPGLQIDTSSVMGYEVQSKRKAHSLHVHTFFTSLAFPDIESNDDLKLYLKRVKCKVVIDPVNDFTGWYSYCTKDSTVDPRWTYEQYHGDLFQEG